VVTKTSIHRGPLDRRVGKIAEVRLGGTSEEGGTRSWSVVLGGASSMPFHLFEGGTWKPPLITPLVVEGPVKLPKPLRDVYGDLVGDPAAWASFAVEKLKAKLIYVYLSSPLHGGTVEGAVKALEGVADEVKAPLIVGAPGDPERPVLDVEVLTRAAEALRGERVALSYATLDQFHAVAKAAKEHGHAVVAYTPTDVNLAKQLNANLLEAGLRREDIIIDPTTAALGWSLEYTYTVFERIRLLALQGDEQLQMPLLAAACNAWTARESYGYPKRLELGPLKLRGVAWEAVTAVAHAAAGADVLVMLHPEAMRLVEEAITSAGSPSTPLKEVLKARVG
jgi:acetyl-CoA decarbonylase/synthase complex subunit delta